MTTCELQTGVYPNAHTVRLWMTIGVKIGLGENRHHITLQHLREGWRLFTHQTWVN